MSELKQISCGAIVFEYEEVEYNCFSDVEINELTYIDVYMRCRVVASDDSKHQVGDVIDQISFEHKMHLENEDGSRYKEEFVPPRRGIRRLQQSLV